MIIKNLKLAEGIYTEEIVNDDYVHFTTKVNGEMVPLGSNNRVINVIDKYGNVLARIQVLDNNQVPIRPTIPEKVDDESTVICPTCYAAVSNGTHCVNCGQKFLQNY